MTNVQAKKSIESVVSGVNSKKGVSGGWPSFIDYQASGSTAILVPNEDFKGDKKGFRQLDAWGMAFVAHLEGECDIKIDSISFLINSPINNKYGPNLKAFIRRISFLQINSNKSIELLLEGKPEPLYITQKELFERPKNEIIRQGLKARDGEGKKWSLEKDLQAFLFGQGFEKDDKKSAGHRPNGRLAILGDDFRGSNAKNHSILREFPTGSFDGKVSKATRILPTEYVDLVSLDKYGKLAVIELKVDDSGLEVISQTLDYALFFGCYFKQLLDVINALKGNDRLSKIDVPDESFNVYMASNVYHPKMKSILPYYSTRDKPYKFSLKQVILGYTEGF